MLEHLSRCRIRDERSDILTSSLLLPHDLSCRLLGLLQLRASHVVARFLQVKISVLEGVERLRAHNTTHT